MTKHKLAFFVRNNIIASTNVPSSEWYTNLNLGASEIGCKVVDLCTLDSVKLVTNFFQDCTNRSSFLFCAYVSF